MANVRMHSDWPWCLADWPANTFIVRDVAQAPQQRNGFP